MKKVAILTLNGYYNYGNRLQIMLLKKSLKSLGFDVVTIIYDRKTTTEKRLLKRIYNLKNYSPPNYI